MAPDTNGCKRTRQAQGDGESIHGRLVLMHGSRTGQRSRERFQRPLACLTQFARKPCLRELPVSLNRFRRNVQNRSGLFNAQASEKTKFHDPRLPVVRCAECVERIVQRQYVRVRFGTWQLELVEGDPYHPGPSLRVPLCASVIDQDPPHQPCGHSQEVCAILPVDPLHFDQSQVRLVHQRCRLKTVTGAFARHAAARDPCKLILNERHQLIQRRMVAAPPVQQQRRNPGIPRQSAAILRLSVP